MKISKIIAHIDQNEIKEIRARVKIAPKKDPDFFADCESIVTDLCNRISLNWQKSLEFSNAMERKLYIPLTILDDNEILCECYVQSTDMDISVKRDDVAMIISMIEQCLNEIYPGHEEPIHAFVRDALGMTHKGIKLADYLASKR